ncbi:MAG TPA: ATP-binding protein [Verrucomicrobiae bacterium]|nr:ATP-binding protein [Verrucomicrobiae bacterium]
MKAGETSSSDGNEDLGTWRESVIALVLVGLAFFIRLAVHPLLDGHYPYVTFFPVAVYAAWKCRWQFSLLIVIAGFGLAHWWFIPPKGSFKMIELSHWYGSTGYLAACAAIIVLGERLRRQNVILKRELRDRAKTEQALVRTAQFPEQNPSPVMRLSADGTFLYSNPASAPLLSAWKTEVGKRAPESLEKWMFTVLQANQIGEHEQTIGSQMYSLVAAPFPNLGYVNLYARDITARVAAEQEQARTLERFHLLSEVSSQLLTAEDPQQLIDQLCVKVMNHLGCEAFFNYLWDDARQQLHLNAVAGMPAAVMKQMEWLDPDRTFFGGSPSHPCRLDTDALATSDDPDAKLLRDLGFRAYACHPLMTSQRMLGTLSFASRSRDAFSEDEFNLIRRISDQVAIALERIRSARSLKESEYRFRTMANASPAMIWIAAPDKRCTWFNTAWLEFVGRTLENDLGSSLSLNVHPEDRERVEHQFNEAFDVRESFEMEFRLRRFDGEHRWILNRGTPVYDAGEFKGYIGSCVDVHERHLQRDHLELAVRERTAQLQDSMAELESFSYSIAHDMRAPLRAMHGFAKILTQETEGRLDDTQREYLRRIVTSAQRLDALIQDVLNYSRLARTDLQLEPIATDTFIRDILLSYPDFSPARAHIHIPNTLPAVMANRAAMTQVVSNVLGNAVKFVEPGVFPNVEITAETTAERVRLSFRDNGIGIEPEAQERIFKMFQRLNRTELYEGTGIGLAIVRKAMERMGGSVSLESTLGEGSTFHIDFKPATTP